MPFFEKDKFRCEIVLNNPPTSNDAVFTGESITGCVKVHANEAATMRGIILGYTVREHFASIPLYLADNTERASNMLQGSRLRHKMQYLLLGSRNHPPIDVPRGEFSYPFVIAVPENMPPTCPPTILGAGSNCCNCCQCYCGSTHANIIKIEHTLAVEIIIPFSLLDNKDTLQEVRVHKSVHPSALLYSPMRFGSQRSDVFSLGAFLPQGCIRCCSCVLQVPSIPAAFHLEVTNPLIVLSDPQPIGFTVKGTLRCRFLAQLVRRCRVHFPGQTFPVVTKAVISHCECPPIGGEGGISCGTLPTSHLASRSSPVSISGSTVEVTYYVEIKPHFYMEHDGCCVDYMDSMRVSVNVDVVHCTSERAVVPAHVGQSMIRAEQSLGVFAQNSREDERNPVVGVVFGYQPPEGLEREYAPAGPILEPLGPPVWGALMST